MAPAIAGAFFTIREIMSFESYLKFKKTDIIIPVAAACVSGLLFALFCLPVFAGDKGNTVIVSVAGKEYGRYDLSEDLDIVIPGDRGLNNHLVIKNGEADIIDADCPDKICVHEKKISREGETLVCLPNKVLIEIEGERKSDIDAVSR